MTRRVNHLRDPEAFIAQFLELAWKGCRESGIEGNMAREDLRSAMAGFPLAFQIVFGREPGPREWDLAKLGAEERIHAWLLERGCDERGFTYSKWRPGSFEMLKLRHRLGLPGGVRNGREYDALLEDIRAFVGKLCSARAEELGRPLEMGDIPAIEEAAAREYRRAS